MSLGRKSGSSGTPWSTSLTWCVSLPWCRFSMHQCRRWGEQLPDILSFFDALMPDPEQVIEVPKILPDDVPVRAAVRDTQLGEQLVEVPTEPGYALSVIVLKFFSRREILGYLSGQGSTASGSWVVDNPVLRFGEVVVHVEVFKVLVLDRIQQRNWSRSLIFQLADVFQIFSRARVPQLPHRVVCVTMQMRLLQWVFRTFPSSKKSAKLGSHSRSELLPESSPSTRRAYEDPCSRAENRGSPAVAAPDRLSMSSSCSSSTVWTPLCSCRDVFTVLNTVVDMPVASNDRCLGLSAGNCVIRSCSADIVVDVPVCAGRRLGLLLEMPQTQFIARVCGPSSFQRDVGLSARVCPELSASFRSPP